MEEHYVARLEFLCPRGFGMQLSLGLCMQNAVTQNAGTYCPHFFLFPKINLTLWVLIKMKRSLALFSSKILTTVKRMEHLPTRMKETRHTLGIGPKTFRVLCFIIYIFLQLSFGRLMPQGKCCCGELGSVFSQMKVLSHMNKAENYERDWKTLRWLTNFLFS